MPDRQMTMNHGDADVKHTQKKPAEVGSHVSQVKNDKSFSLNIILNSKNIKIYFNDNKFGAF